MTKEDDKLPSTEGGSATTDDSTSDQAAEDAATSAEGHLSDAQAAQGLFLTANTDVGTLKGEIEGKRDEASGFKDEAVAAKGLAQAALDSA